MQWTSANTVQWFISSVLSLKKLFEYPPMPDLDNQRSRKMCHLTLSVLCSSKREIYTWALNLPSWTSRKVSSLPQSLFRSLNQKRQGRNCKIQRFIAVLETSRSLSVSRKGDLILLRMERNLFMWELGSETCLETHTNLTEILGAKKGMSESYTRRDSLVLPIKINFHDGSQGMLSLRKRWCWATNGKLFTCLVIIYSQRTLENSGFSLIEQCNPQENQLSEHSVPSGDVNPSDIPREKKVAVVRLCWEKLEGLPWRGDLTSLLGLNQIWLQLVTPNLVLIYACSGSSVGGIACFAYANCSI